MDAPQRYNDEWFQLAADGIIRYTRIHPTNGFYDDWEITEKGREHFRRLYEDVRRDMPHLPALADPVNKRPVCDLTVSEFTQAVDFIVSTVKERQAARERAKRQRRQRIVNGMLLCLVIALAVVVF